MFSQRPAHRIAHRPGRRVTYFLASLLLAGLMFVGQSTLSWAQGITPAANGPALRHAIEHASRGETIFVATGRYDLTDIKIPNDVTLIGDSDVVFFSSRSTAKGILNPRSGVSLYVENIRFEGATSPDKNGAGIRHDGANLTIVNCVFENNENGVLATGEKTGRIRIRGTHFIGNGYGDGYSHGIYVVRASTLEISDSRFEGTKIGHHVKSLAKRTRVTGSTLDDGKGRTSYAVDVSKGGDVLIAENTIIQAVDADNSTIINYDLSRGGDASGLAIINNRIINRHRNGALLRNKTDLQPIVSGNEVINEGRGRLTQP